MTGDPFDFDDEQDDNDQEDDFDYGFLPEHARRDDEQWGYQRHDASWWGIGDHDEDGPDWDEVEEAFDTLDDVPGLESLIGEAERVAERYQNTGFECSVCGLYHSHGTDKHDVRDFFGVTEEFVDKMNFTAYCHCGVHELARLLNYFRSIDVQVFEDENAEDFDIQERRQEIASGARQAPIPEEVRTQLNEKLGTV